MTTLSAPLGPSLNGTACPVPRDDGETIQLAHGGGGRMMRQLIERVIAAELGEPALRTDLDSAVLDAKAARLAFTTDSYVVSPLFFPGGDIGTLAVNGTVNDLAMAGARPLALSAALILEEGLPVETLRRVLRSMGAAARAAGVRIVTGDTKVVDRGKGDGLFITTSGVGTLRAGVEPAPALVRPGDVVLLSGDLGRHGMAILSVREGLEFESAIVSDCAPLHDSVKSMLDAGIDVHCLRDLTRGGLASALVEIADSAKVEIELEETSIPVADNVQAACELLGLDPLYVANEGRFAAFVAEPDAERALAALRRCVVSTGACRIGQVTGQAPRGRVNLRTALGTRRPLDLLSGEQLPRIC
jgi:hydrogenase expression/formation protein HypE